MTDRPRPAKAEYRFFLKYTIIKEGKYKKITGTIRGGKYIDTYAVHEAMDRFAYRLLTHPELWHLITKNNETLTADHFKIQALLEIKYTNYQLSLFDKRRQIKKTIQIAPTLTLDYKDIIPQEPPKVFEPSNN